MSPSASSSSSSSSEAEASNKPTKLLKRKLQESESDSDSDNDGDDSESEQEDEVAKEGDEAGSDEDEEENGDEEVEVEVLSHAEKRRLKKKQKLEESAQTSPSKVKSKSKRKDGDEKKSSKDSNQKKAELPKRQNSVWVGNLSFKTTPENLKTFFDGVGEITRVHMPMKLASGGGPGKGPAKENRGFAYVDFGTADAKTLAITLSEKNLDGRRLLIKDGGDFTGRPAVPADTPEAAKAGGAATSLAGHTKTAQKILNAQKQPAGPTLFLGNLGFETTVENITEMITAHHKGATKDRKGKEKEIEAVADEEIEDKEAEKKKGGNKDGGTSSEVGIRKVRMGTFEDSGLCKGFAFVDFISAEHATTVLINPRNHKLNGRQLVVEYASPDAVRRGGHREKGVGATKGQADKFRSSKRGDGASRENAKRSGDGERSGRDENGSGNNNEMDVDNHASTDSFNRGRSGSGFNEKRVGKNDGTKTRWRPKPGAALALAKRESVAIVPSEGTRITF